MISMGQLPKPWKAGIAKEITFCVTEDCNLSCKYCYMTGKNNINKMSFDVAKQAVDYILADRENFNNEAIVWGFTGGEPFLEIELIDQITDYIKIQMYSLEHPWFNNYMLHFSTNGILYDAPKVQNYIKKNKEHCSINISIDGNKIKHDLQRIKKDGSGSYDDVVKNVKLWQEQFIGTSTKSTFTHEDLPYLKESIISLWELGIKMVAANVVFEDVWNDGDDLIFERQLVELADYTIEKKMWDDYSVRFFSPDIGFPLTEEEMQRNFCGTGKMLAIDCNGNFLPCVRFLDISLNNRNNYSIGNIYTGINKDKLRPFKVLSLKNISNIDCLQCNVASGCGYCTGFNYDYANTIFQRATYVCKMHKANVRANKYFWEKFAKTTGLVSPREEYLRKRKSLSKYLLIITSDKITPHCSYRNSRINKTDMSQEILLSGLDYAKKNDYIPVFLGLPLLSNFEANEHLLIIDEKSYKGQNNAIIIYDNNIEHTKIPPINSILLITPDNIKKISNYIIKLINNNTERINLILENVENWKDHDLHLYEIELNKIISYIVERYSINKHIKINVLTDLFELTKMNNCDAGISTICLAPNGNFYICPAFYFNNSDNIVGNLKMGINNNYLNHIDKWPICSECDTYHCRRCLFINKKLTNEFYILNMPGQTEQFDR
ncbi:molybdenum cofactor biosynthesis protein A [Pelotomaculum schinkii]|uniref:Molybdenum cofactor biosynthesis protein A n=1 Tax=Pelotomaculum schinkii TaxID=78350 RepID=A0A4Y7RFC6_9FIRM|nr:radical SAM peptide maturase, CXXX-repeat target family [Pelotomaculum schinkii]TEB07483.1 molybdenum cofactor biosynthesis protein A [Pelotomaculum schinkii]